MKKLFLKIDEAGIRYVFLRNFDFYSGNTKNIPKDYDVLFHSKDRKKLLGVMKKEGFVNGKNVYDNLFESFRGFFDNKIIGIDARYGGLLWNQNSYWSEDKVFETKVKQQWFYRLSDEEYLVDLIAHSILGKRYFKEEYKKEITRLLKTTDEKKVRKILTNAFSEKTARKTLLKLRKKDFVISYYWLIAQFIFKSSSRIINFSHVFLKWLLFYQTRKLRLRPMIAFIGLDGTGKTTTTNALVDILRNNDVSCFYVYTGRGNANMLPIRRVGDAYKKKEKNIKEKKLVKQILYSLAAPVFAFDLWLRYWLKVFPKRLRGTVVTDRYASDLLLMPNVPYWVRKLLFFFFPKPHYIYLYNDISTLQQRRDHSVSDLRRQENIFKKINTILKPHMVKTDSKKQTLREVLNHVNSLLK